MVSWLILAAIVAGFLFIGMELRYWGGKIVNELIETGTLLADILETLNDRRGDKT
jgi:hypothetical protein